MLFLFPFPEPCSTIPINRSPGTNMGRDLFWEGSVFQHHMFFLKRNHQSTSLVLVYLLQTQSQIWSSTCKSYCARTTPRSTSLSTAQKEDSHRNTHWTVPPGLRAAATHCHTLHVLFHPRPSHMSFPLLMILFSFWPINSYLAFSSQFIEDPSSGTPHLNRTSTAHCRSPVIAYPHSTIAHCSPAIAHTGLQAQPGQILPPIFFTIIFLLPHIMPAQNRCSVNICGLNESNDQLMLIY